MNTVPTITIVNFTKYNPPHKAVNKEVREGGRLKWFRCEATWYEDEAVMSLPADERYLWLFLLARAARGQPVGTIRESTEHLARLANTTRASLEHALDHLTAWERIRGWRRDPPSPAGAIPVRPDEGGDAPPGHHPNGGHVPTLPTDPPTHGRTKARGVRAAPRSKYGMDAKTVVDEYVAVRARAGLETDQRSPGQLATQVMRCRDRGWSLELCLEAVRTFGTSRRAVVFFDEWVASVFNAQTAREHAAVKASDVPMTRAEYEALLEKARAAAALDAGGSSASVAEANR